MSAGRQVQGSEAENSPQGRRTGSQDGGLGPELPGSEGGDGRRGSGASTARPEVLIVLASLVPRWGASHLIWSYRLLPLLFNL